MKRALAREPEQRYQDARAFGEALRDVARQHGMLYSTPQLAAELAELLGADPDSWSQDDSYNETERLPLGKTLVGKEAASIGVVDDALARRRRRAENTVSLRPPRGIDPAALRARSADRRPGGAHADAGAALGRSRGRDLRERRHRRPVGASDTLERPVQVTPEMPPTPRPAPRFRAPVGAGGAGADRRRPAWPPVCGGPSSARCRRRTCPGWTACRGPGLVRLNGDEQRAARAGRPPGSSTCRRPSCASRAAGGW